MQWIVPVLAVLVMAGPARGSSESYWSSPNAGQHLGVEAHHVLLDDGVGVDTKFPYGALNVTLRTRLNERLMFLADLPVGYARGTDNRPGTPVPVEFDETSIGNPYLGLEIGDRSTPAYGQVGVRFPSAKEEEPWALGAGALADMDRYEAYQPEVVSLNLLAHVGTRENEGPWSVRARVEPVLMIPTKSGGSVEWIAHYGAALFFRQADLCLGAGMSGLAFLSTTEAESGDLDDTAHQVGLSASWEKGVLNPGVLWRVPVQGNRLDDVVSSISFTLRYRLGE